MTSYTTFDLFVLAWMALAMAIFVLLFFVHAPTGGTRAKAGACAPGAWPFTC